MKLLMQGSVWRRERLSACQAPQCISGQKSPALRDVLAPAPQVQWIPRRIGKYVPEMRDRISTTSMRSFVEAC
jgi:hypothetical protein